MRNVANTTSKWLFFSTNYHVSFDPKALKIGPIVRVVRNNKIKNVKLFVGMVLRESLLRSESSTFCCPDMPGLVIGGRTYSQYCIIPIFPRSLIGLQKVKNYWIA